MAPLDTDRHVVGRTTIQFPNGKMSAVLPLSWLIANGFLGSILPFKHQSIYSIRDIFSLVEKGSSTKSLRDSGGRFAE
jgi:hypothetical protein